MSLRRRCRSCPHCRVTAGQNAGFDPPMGRRRGLIGRSGTSGLRVRALAVALALAPASALAQNSSSPSGRPGFIAAVSQWFSEQAGNIASTFKDAGKAVENFGTKAEDTARTTVEGAKGAADAVVRLPRARVVSGHQKCQISPNGAPDCLAAATALCAANGFGSGSSLDMTTAEVCPPAVYLAGRTSGPGCTTETFVSRALCQ